MYLSTHVLAASEGEGGGAADLLLPAWPELVAGIIAFSLVYFFVWKWVWPSMTRTIEARRAAVTGQIEAAEKAKAEAESLLADYRGQLAEAKNEANRLIEEARQTAEQMRTDILTKAESDGEQIRSKARDEAAGEKSRALAEARSQVGDISVDLAGKIVGETLDGDAHRALIDRYLADLEKL